MPYRAVSQIAPGRLTLTKAAGPVATPASSVPPWTSPIAWETAARSKWPVVGCCVGQAETTSLPGDG